ncbi:arylsulfatase [Aspergillus eucalypticola CBS 122712]|uniref:Arylsulfatase n=1 Tax=Aspergillus eucalypticola (strain CBS 122712 / IBT 29274) TaxID=1448314 RepID=A0A317VXJ9_ASPEC|nr:arylsulfatase [Aspergillus eucalypticola CBS 122712]PWY78993.1 arylsulfatase [Aspergillus eucalypticola CBS 122712]
MRNPVCLLALAGFTTQSLGQQQQQPLYATAKPNVVFILTDDQDAQLGSLDYMPYVKKHLLDKGTHYRSHYCTTSVCCPSRVTLWTGKLAHNTNVTDVNPPHGGYPKFISQGLNDNYLPVWLQEAGYNTYYTGKLFNVHTVDNYNAPFPAGFTGNDFLLDPFTYDYLNSTFQRDRDPPQSYEGEYSTDVLAQKAYRLLDEAVAAQKPFFLTVAPIAPHCNVFMNGTGLDANPKFSFSAPIPAKRHEHLFSDIKVPRTPSFNPETPSGANWIKTLKRQNDTNVEYNDHFYRQRLRALQAVDELVDGLFTRLKEYDILDNTYVVYSSDNGYHIGQHRLQPGKSCGYEEDINVPLIVRGPNVAQDVSTDIVTTHTDLAPTFLDLLGIPLREDFDGDPIPFTENQIKEAHDERQEHVTVEYWGYAAGEGIYDFDLSAYNNTYKALRIRGSEYNLYYSVWCNNEHELYDMTSDPHQLHNLLSTSGLPNATSYIILNVDLSKVVQRLDSLLLVLKTCKGQVCVKPWDALHPRGEVTTLKDALDVRYDYYYEVEQTTRVQFNECARGYFLDAEGPQFVQGAEYEVLRDGLPCSIWDLRSPAAPQQTPNRVTLNPLLRIDWPDELSMHLLTTPLLYRILSFQATPQYTKTVGIVLSVLFTIVMVVHMVMDEFLLHAVTFGTAVYLIATRTLKIIPREIPDVEDRKRIQNVALFGCASFIFGYLVWLVDEWVCQSLIGARHAVGLPVAFLLELHGWWHVFTAIGGYIAVAIIDLITSGELQRDSVAQLAWPLPTVARLLGPAGGEMKRE